ncbi:PqiC family protein [Tritonibacter multivorans]|nr:PqiC family protein [Tritonibacter multivorans]MDA7422109.1 PqiC family protein [Tritonibacter multivorans]
MIQKTLTAVLATALLTTVAACSSNDERYLLPEVTDVAQVRSPVRSVEVQEIDLPDYVADSSIFLPDENGILRLQKNQSWADEPARAMTEQLSAGLDLALKADVASEPWPFVDRPQAQVEVRLQGLTVLPSQTLRMTGQFFVKSDDFIGLQTSKRFAIEVPIDGEGIPALAAARRDAMHKLVARIATALAR